MKILITDIETTGFLSKNPHKSGKIVEVGLVELDLKNGKTKTVFDMLIDPELSIKQLEKSWIVDNGFIKAEDIQKRGAFWEDVEEDIQKHIQGYKNGLTAYNRKFDVDFLKSYGIEFGKLLPCPMLALTPILKLPKKNGWTGFKWPSVMEAHRYFFPESDYEELHRGADDAHHEGQIIYELHKLGKFLPKKEIPTFTK